MQARIVLLPGDGIGPEVVGQAERVLAQIAHLFGHSFHFETHLVGGCSIDANGEACTLATLEACQKADAVVLGAVGGPKWDDPNAKVRPEQGLFRLRKGLNLFANLRPVKAYPALAQSSSPLRPERALGVDLLVVRELTGGIYFGEPRFRDIHNGERRAVDTMVYTESEIRRVVQLAFTIARGRRRQVTQVDKANVLDTSRLWRQVTGEVAKDFPDVSLENQLVDSCAMRLVTNPGSFDVVVTENLFGDILSDEAAVITGSLGMLPSASLGDGPRGLYEPIHGSAPDIAGLGIANPLGTILSCAMLLRHSLSLEAEAKSIERAVEKAIDEGCRTKDLGGTMNTTAMGDAVLARLSQ